MAFSDRPRKHDSLRCCLIHRNSSSIPAFAGTSLPPRLVESGDFDGGAAGIVGDHLDHAAVFPLDADAAQGTGEPGFPLAGKPDIVIGEDREAIALLLGDTPRFDDVEGDVFLRPGDENGSGGVNAAPPAIVAIAFVEDI